MCRVWVAIRAHLKMSDSPQIWSSNMVEPLWLRIPWLQLSGPYLIHKALAAVISTICWVKFDYNDVEFSCNALERTKLPWHPAERLTWPPQIWHRRQVICNRQVRVRRLSEPTRPDVVFDEWQVVDYPEVLAHLTKQRCFLSSQSLYWPGNISGDPTYGPQHQDSYVGVHMLDHRKYFLANKGFGLTENSAVSSDESMCCIIGWRRRRQSFSRKRRTCEIWSIRYERKLLPGFFQRFCIFTPFWVRFPIWIFSNGLNQQWIFLIERKLWVAADLKIVGVAMVLWDETHAWNCLFVVRLQMRTWNNASKRPEGYYNIVEIPFRFVLKHVACKISGVIWKNQCQENSQVQKTQFCSLFLDDACDAYWSLMLVHHRPRVPTRNSRSSKLWCRVRELNGIQQKWHA